MAIHYINLHESGRPQVVPRIFNL